MHTHTDHIKPPGNQEPSTQNSPGYLQPLKWYLGTDVFLQVLAGFRREGAHMPPVGSEYPSVVQVCKPRERVRPSQTESTTQLALEVITTEINYQGLTTMVGLEVGGPCDRG